jgi:hypothetical protein
MDRREEIINRIKECETVLAELEGSKLYEILEKDAKLWNDLVNKQWTDAYLGGNQVQLRNLAVARLANNHILQLRSNYKANMEEAQKELYKIDNPEKVTGKDFDNETNIEK